MNFACVFEKVLFIFLFVFCYISTFTSIEAEGSVRVIKRKISGPVHIHLSGGPPSTNYAKKFGYGRPLTGYNFQYNHYKRNKRYFGRRNGKYGAKNYANGFKNWTPNRIYGGKYNTKLDNEKRGPYPLRKEPTYPFLREPSFKGNKQKRKVRPHRANTLQRPKPPKYLKELDDDYYFPEETLKSDTRYEGENEYQRYKKKRKSPSEKTQRRPELIHSSDEEKITRKYKKRLRGTPLYPPYGHNPSEEEEDYDDDIESSQNAEVIKSKKKKIKKKSNSRKRNKETENFDSAYQYDLEDTSDGYHTIYFDEYDPTERSSKKTTQKVTYKTTGYKKANYLPPSVPPPVKTYNDFRQTYNSQDNVQYPGFSQQWPVSTVTTEQPIIHNNINRYQPQPYQNQINTFQTASNSYSYPSTLTPNQYNYQTLQNQYNYQNNPHHYNYQHNQEISNAKKPQIITANTQQTNYYAPPDNGYKSFVVNSQYGTNQEISSTPQVHTFTYNSLSNSNGVNNNPHVQHPSYQQTSVTYSDNTLKKKNPSYETTEKFYENLNNNNGNGFVKSQSLSYLNNNSQRFDNRLTSSSYHNLNVQDENDFLKKHQNFYNKGFSGVPVQGDGHAKANSHKEYDIGYGDFLFDENATS